MKLKTKKKLS